MIILGFDFGTKRIGVAVGQAITQTATPLTTLTAQEGIPAWEEIDELIKTWQATDIVVGIPLNMDNTEQEITLAAREFAKHLKRQFHLPVHCVDERLTTREAKQEIFAAGGYKALTKTQIDSVAAKILLEQWMTTLR